MEALVYLRISQDRSGQQAGVDRQREACLQRCRERGWSVFAVEQDNDISAAGKRHRPGFEAMLKAIEGGKAQHIVAWSLDRLQRNRRDEVRLYEVCREKGATLSLVNGADIDFGSATGRLVADQLGSIARFEIELKSDRQQAAQYQAAQKGLRSGGRRPFGYEQDGVRVRETEAEAIREGYAAVLAGESLAEVARMWNAAGLLPDQKRWAEGHKGSVSSWSRTSVRLVLLNPRNIAKRRYKGEIIADAIWPAIVDIPTFEAVKAVLSHPSRRHTATSARRMLSGLAVCGICGSTVHAGGAARAGVATYRCSGSTGHFARMADPVDAYVSRLVVGRLSMPDAAKLMASDGHPDLERLRADADAARQRREAFTLGFARGTFTEEQLRIVTEETLALEREVEAELADAGKADILGPLIAAEDVQTEWDGWSDARRRQVVDTLMTVTIHPVGRGTRTFRAATVGITWKI